MSSTRIRHSNSVVTPTEYACIRTNATREYNYIYAPEICDEKGKKMPFSRLLMKKYFAGMKNVCIFATETS